MNLYVGQAMLTSGWTTKSCTLVLLAESPDIAMAQLRAHAFAESGDGWRLESSDVHPVPAEMVRLAAKGMVNHVG